MIHANKPRTTAIVIAISVSSLLLALGPITFGNQAAQAQGNPNLGFVSGGGSGQIVCPNGQSSSADIAIFGQEDTNGQWDGGFEIGIPGTTQKEGVITDGHVTPSRFSLQGTETTDILCAEFGGGNPTTVSIRGQCDDNATIEFRAANGQRGTFIGDVFCARISN